MDNERASDVNNISTCELTEDDWNDITTAITSLAGRWRQLAGNLGLSPGRIDTIDGDFSNNTDRLNEVILVWLRHKHNYKKKGLPSWSTLSKAVEPINSALAKKLIAKQLESGKSSDVCWKKVPLPTGTAAEGDRNTTTDHHHRAKQHSRCSCSTSSLTIVYIGILVTALIGVCLFWFLHREGIFFGSTSSVTAFLYIGMPMTALIGVCTYLFWFLHRKGDKFIQPKTTLNPDQFKSPQKKVHRRIDLELEGKGFISTTLNKYNIVVCEHYGLNERTGFWWLRFRFDYVLDKGIELRLTNFKYGDRSDWTLEIVRCRYIHIDSEDHMASFDMADEFINSRELQQIVDCSRSNESLRKYLEDNIIPLVIKKIKYTRYKPQFHIYLSYHSQDNMPFMHTFENGLKFLGYETWLDETNIAMGSNRLSAIKTAIDQCDVFIAWLNPTYMEDSVAQAELRYAYSKKKIILAFGTNEVRKYFIGEFQFLSDLHVHDPHKGSFFEVLRRIDSDLFEFEKLTF